MGLFTAGDEYENVRIASIIAEATCRRCSDELSKLPDGAPVRVGFKAPNILHMCRVAHDIFASGAFPESPGPYKRAAALVALSRMYMIYSVEPLVPGPQPSFDERQKIEVSWNSRLALASLKPLFGHLVVELSGVEKSILGWSGFPSRHVKLEVTNWLRWLMHNDQYGNAVEKYVGRPIDWKRFALERKIRAVLALSLILENSHYASLGERRFEIMGQDHDCLRDKTQEQELDLMFG